MTEIIDLTDESPTPQNFVDLTSDLDEDAVPSKSASSENGKKRLRKRKKKKTRTTENGQTSGIPPTSTENMSKPRFNDAYAASTSTSRPEDTSQLYFIDITPVPLPAPIAVQQPPPETQTDTLLLPAHVAIFRNEHIQIVSLPQKEIGEEDYIEYLAYDDYKASSTCRFFCPRPRLKHSYKDIPRYFEDQSKEENKNKVVCKNCGAEGDHKTSTCPVIVVRCVVLFGFTIRIIDVLSSA